MIAYVILFYLLLLPLAGLSLRGRMPRFLLMCYTLPFCVALSGLVFGSRLFLLGLVLALILRPLGGKILFQKIHFSHFLVHGMISLLFAVLLLYF